MGAQMRALIEKFPVLYFPLDLGTKGIFRARKSRPMRKEGKVKVKHTTKRPKGVTLFHPGSDDWKWKWPDLPSNFKLRRLATTETFTHNPGSVSLGYEVTSPSTNVGITKSRIPAPAYHAWAPFAMILMLFCVLCWIIHRRLRTLESRKRSTGLGRS